MTINLLDVINHRCKQASPPFDNLIQERLTRPLPLFDKIEFLSTRTPEENRRVFQHKIHEEPCKPFVPEMRIKP